MWSWLFGESNRGGGTLILRPHASAVGMPGFPTSSELRLVANAGETVGDVMDRFNTYRGPDHQITRLYAALGDAAVELPFSSPVTGTVVAIVRRI